jgi:cytochrome b pre-mRNA-processing protein 3
MLKALRRNSHRAKLVRTLYAAVNAQARQKIFFADLGVADSLDGRFDMVALHAWLVFERLRAAELADVAHALSDAIFVGFDEALRDLGAGDMGMGRKIKQMGDAFNGRINAYGGARNEAELSAAILRNVYRGERKRVRDALALARYAIAAQRRLAASNVADGELNFGPLPEQPGRT